MSGQTDTVVPVTFSDERESIERMRTTAKRLDVDASADFTRICTYAIRYLALCEACNTGAQAVSIGQRQAMRTELVIADGGNNGAKSLDDAQRRRINRAELRIRSALRTLKDSPTFATIVQQIALTQKHAL